MARTKKPIGPVCRWTEADEGYFDTDCGHAFVLNTGTPPENHMRFCAYCGRALQFKPAEHV